MRRLILASVAALSLAPSLAAAQHSGSPTADLLDLAIKTGQNTQWSATVPAPLAGLSRETRAWMRDEAERQAETPRSAVEVAMAVDAAVGQDLARMARDKRYHPQDVSSAVLLTIMNNARSALMRELKAVRKAGEDDTVAAQRLSIAEANRREAMELQSPVSVALATR